MSRCRLVRDRRASATSSAPCTVSASSLCSIERTLASAPIRLPSSRNRRLLRLSTLRATTKVQPVGDAISRTDGQTAQARLKASSVASAEAPRSPE